VGRKLTSFARATIGFFVFKSLFWITYSLSYMKSQLTAPGSQLGSHRSLAELLIHGEQTVML